MKQFYIKTIIFTVLFTPFFGWSLASIGPEETAPVGYALALLFGTIMTTYSSIMLYRTTRKTTEKESMDTSNWSATPKCPNCSNNIWYDGPGGGSFGNIQCANCRKKYNNLGPFGLQEIS